jgi:signal transduction histidine kinase
VDVSSYGNATVGWMPGTEHVPTCHRFRDTPAHAIADERGAVCAYCGQLNARHTALTSTQKEQTELVCTLVHQLRTPALASKVLVYALQHSNGHDSDIAPILSRIRVHMDQLLDLVDDILQLSQA